MDDSGPNTTEGPTPHLNANLYFAMGWVWPRMQ